MSAHVEVYPVPQARAPETVLSFQQVHIYHKVAVSDRHPEAQLDIVHHEVHAVQLEGLCVP